MNDIVPPSFLFDYLIPICACSSPRKAKRGSLLQLAGQQPLFFPSQLNGQHLFAELRLGWNTDGLAMQVNVTGKQHPANGRSTDPDRSDCVLIWIDTRPTGDVHRATQFCHHFGLFPCDELREDDPSAVVIPIAQQREQKIESNPDRFQLRTRSNAGGYIFEIWIPSTQLYGFDEVSELRRIGFYCTVRDTELGDQTLSVSDDFPVAFDPSTWLQLELQE